MKVYWHHGLEAATADEAFWSTSAAAQFDAAWIGTSDRVLFGKGGIGRADDAVSFRRARLDIEATMWEQVDFYTQIDFLNTTNVIDNNGDVQTFNTPAPTDLWATFTKLPILGNLRVGNQKPPVSFEHLVSSRFLDFLERSLAYDAFVENQNNGFQPGIQAFNWFADERATWARRLLKNTRQRLRRTVATAEAQVTGRVTWLPWYSDDGRCLLHLGLGGYYRDTDDHIARYRRGS
jgi:phosphate-selective porin OprO/OprP